MFIFSIIMGILLISLGVSLRLENPGMIPLPFMLGFVFSFQASTGPITWLYMAEIMQEKGLSIGTVLNWLFTLLFTVAMPTVKNIAGISGVGILFIVVGSFTLGCAVFIALVMKETKGKTLAERKNLYVN